ncbi:MAG TPA: fatty acid desaturase, partial [Rhodobacteraceae bacterium]|nr:fatty acid desaturase [Paracoccaceae bacterium]
AATGALALILWSILPLMVIGLPRLYGAWHHVMTGVLQHGGLAEDVLDHRLNTRTVYMNRISRFIYLDMN